MSGLLTGAALALALLQTSPQAQDDPTVLDDVVVEGRLAEQLARDFIGEIGAPPRGVSVARWQRSVCVGVVNLRPSTAQFVIDRVSSLAAEVGLEPGEPGCSPDILIVATNDGAGVATGLVERRLRTFSPGGDGFTRGRRALERFKDNEDAVRWWHISQTIDPDTGDGASFRPGTDRFSSRLDSVPQVTVVPTLLRSAFRQDLRRAIVIIDFSKVGEVDFDQLADYVAFVSLAQIDPEADTSAFPTILNVFDDPAATQRLTDWDRAYLRGLYQSDDTAPTNATREAAIRREMLRARGEAPTEPED